MKAELDSESEGEPSRSCRERSGALEAAAAGSCTLESGIAEAYWAAEW